MSATRSDEQTRLGGRGGGSGGGWRRAVRDFLFGMFRYEAAQTALEMRESLEKIFVLGTFGDMIGVPVLPPYYSLRLLPHLVPAIASWKRRFARERELGDSHDYHLHGV